MENLKLIQKWMDTHPMSNLVEHAFVVDVVAAATPLNIEV